MRDLAKSMARFSWAMSVYGAHQLAAVTSDTEDEQPTAEPLHNAIDDVTEATARDFDQRSRSLFDAGTRMSEEMIDIAFEVMNPKVMAKRTSRVISRAADVIRDLVPEEEESESSEPS